MGYGKYSVKEETELSHSLGPALSLSLIGQDSFLTDLITNICGTIDKLH